MLSCHPVILVDGYVAMRCCWQEARLRRLRDAADVDLPSLASARGVRMIGLQALGASKGYLGYIRGMYMYIYIYIYICIYKGPLLI